VASNQISAVAFDLGGVLIDWNPRHLYRHLFADPGEMEDFLARICTDDWHREHDLGQTSPRRASASPRVTPVTGT
jgi:2-haloacid dehalogenase